MVVPEPGVVTGRCSVVEFVVAPVVRGPSVDPDSVEVDKLLLSVVKGSSLVAVSGLVEVTAVTEVVLVTSMVVVIFWDSSGEEVVASGRPSVLFELGVVARGSTVVFDSVVTGPSVESDSPDMVVSLPSVV